MCNFCLLYITKYWNFGSGKAGTYDAVSFFLPANGSRDLLCGNEPYSHIEEPKYAVRYLPVFTCSWADACRM